MSRTREEISFGEAQVSAYRMDRHHLSARASRADLPAVVGDTCGVQAQVMAMARIALWARVESLTTEDIERALDRTRTIVRTWSLRGALHLHRSSDLAVVQHGLMATRLAREQRWIRREGLDEEETTRLVLDALRDGPMTKVELAERLNRRVGARTRKWRDGGWGVSKKGSSLAWYLVRPAMARGLACYGPSSGQEVTFARTDRWLPKRPKTHRPVDAEAELIRRYLHSFGPADAKDFRMWAGVYMTQVRPALARLRGELVDVDVGGRRCQMLREDLPRLEASEADRGVVRLLPSFDPFLLGHADRGHLVDRGHYKRVYKDQGWLAPVVLLDGRVAGTWSYRRGSRTLAVDVRPFAPIPARTRAKVKEQAQDLARFLGARGVAVRFGR